MNLLTNLKIIVNVWKILKIRDKDTKNNKIFNEEILYKGHTLVYDL